MELYHRSETPAALPLLAHGCETTSDTLSMSHRGPVLMNQMLAGRANGRTPECQSSGVPHLVTPQHEAMGRKDRSSSDLGVALARSHW